jgi:hypothetical protein
VKWFTRRKILGMNAARAAPLAGRLCSGRAHQLRRHSIDNKRSEGRHDRRGCSFAASRRQGAKTLIGLTAVCCRMCAIAWPDPVGRSHLPRSGDWAPRRILPLSFILRMSTGASVHRRGHDESRPSSASLASLSGAKIVTLLRSSRIHPSFVQARSCLLVLSRDLPIIWLISR